MKECTICRLSKLETEYHYKNKSKGVRRSACRDCCNKATRLSNKDRYSKNKKSYRARLDRLKKRNKAYVYELLSKSSCLFCGYNDNVAALQFDHIDRRDKIYSVSSLANSSYSIERIKQEISKCRILCANCHAVRTSKQLGWYKDIHKQ